MRIDLKHNKILEQTMSDAFVANINDDLCPKLCAVYGDEMVGIQMYEDYLGDNFVKDGFRYYPLTVVTTDSVTTCWIRWNTASAADFEGGNPYAFVGDKIDFELTSEVPMAFANALNGRGRYYEEGLVKMNVSFSGKDYSMLIGKYSQTFVDEMARQLTAVIERACGVSGLAASSIELDLFFAPDTYMEHTSENVTYRRLLMSAKGCAPRDFWIKWTRKDSAVAYSVNDNVSADGITFEIGENVSQKIREKEYRFLVYMNSDKYRNAMGRKNITEWRELIKRAVKKGELTKGGTAPEIESHASEVSDKLAEILQKCGVEIPVVNVEPVNDTNAATEALRRAYLESTERGEEYAVADDTAAVAEAVEENTESDLDFDLGKEYPQVEFELTEDTAPEEDERGAEFVFTENGFERIEIEKVTEEEKAEESATAEVAAEDIAGTPDAEPEEEEPVFEKAPVSVTESEGEYLGDDSTGASNNEDILALMVEIERLEAKLREAEAKCAALEEAKTLADGRLDAAIAANADVSARADMLDAQLGEVSEKLSAAEASAEQLGNKLAEACAELASVKEENASLATQAQDLRTRLSTALEENRRAEERYRAQLELEEKERVRDKLLFAEAARKAKEESDRLAKEKADAEARAEAERAALEKERVEAEARLREREEVRIEAERIEKEMANASLQRESALERAREIRRRMEEEARRNADAKYGTVSAPTAEEEVKEAEAEEADVEEAESTDEVNSDTVCTDTDNTVENSGFELEADPTEREPAMDFDVDEVNLVPEEEVAAPEVSVNEPEAPAETEPPTEEPAVEEKPVKAAEPVRYTYTSKIVRMLFRDPIDESITAKLRDLIATAIKIAGKERVYIKMRASIPDTTTVILDILQIPEQEMKLLVDIIHYLGNSNLGIYKVILEE